MKKSGSKVNVIKIIAWADISIAVLATIGILSDGGMDGYDLTVIFLFGYSGYLLLKK